MYVHFLFRLINFHSFITDPYFALIFEISMHSLNYLFLIESDYYWIKLFSFVHHNILLICLILTSNNIIIRSIVVKIEFQVIIFNFRVS